MEVPASYWRKDQRRKYDLSQNQKYINHSHLISENPALNLELPQRYRPTTIKGIVDATGFSNKEIKRLYWSFKNECPSGLVNQEEFHSIFSKYFPKGGRRERKVL